MIAWFLHYLNLRVLILIFVWVFIGAVAFADSLDLSDDIGIPIPQSLQAINVVDVDEVKQGFALVRSPSHIPITLAEFSQENHHSFTGFVRVSDTHSSTSLSPLYDSLCTYRL